MTDDQWLELYIAFWYFSIIGFVWIGCAWSGGRRVRRDRRHGRRVRR